MRIAATIAQIDNHYSLSPSLTNVGKELLLGRPKIYKQTTYVTNSHDVGTTLVLEGSERFWTDSEGAT